MELQIVTGQVFAQIAKLLENEGKAGAKNLLDNFGLIESIAKGGVSYKNNEIRINLTVAHACESQQNVIDVEIVDE